MEVHFTRASVLALAPDPASARLAEGLASPRRWLRVGKDPEALWGECPGSGATSYRAQVDLAAPAFACSCPSRKAPCKHALGLLMMFADRPGSLPDEPRPAWVSAWLEARRARAAARDRPAVIDLEARAERRARRLERIARGLEELGVWLEDLAEGGLSSAAARGHGDFEARARRLVDAQAPGAARWVSRLGELTASGEGWEVRFVDQLGRLHLLTRAFARLPLLSAPLAATVLANLGVPIDDDAASDAAEPARRWQVVGVNTSVEPPLSVRRTWAVAPGADGLPASTALLLDFAHEAAMLPPGLTVGHELEASLAPHPSAPRRRLISRAETSRPLDAFAAWPSIEEALEQHARTLAANPWAELSLCALSQVTPRFDGKVGWAIDRRGDALPLTLDAERGWQLLALSAGRPLAMAGEWDGRRLEVLTIAAEGTLVAFERGPRRERTA
jgi:hypothetical protein